MEQATGCYIGLDIGSAFVHMVALDERGQQVWHFSRAHEGAVPEVVYHGLSQLRRPVLGLFMNLRGRPLLPLGPGVDDQVALVEGVRRAGHQTPAILHIGAERFYLILLDEDGTYRKSISNTGCASGTGSFLDQQASRLNLPSSEALAELAQNFHGEPPPIATRCAVFAKTDLIHAQQKGYSLEAICAGVCRGAARNVVDTILSGEELPEAVLVTGGVARNTKVVEELRRALGRQATAPRNPQLLPALGLAHLALSQKSDWQSEDLEQFLKRGPSSHASKNYHYPPLVEIPYRREELPHRTRFTLEGVEVEIYRDDYASNRRVYLGIDIGSTSTKAAALDEDGKPLLSLYTRTQGQPIVAVQRLFRALHRLEQQLGLTLQLLACGTTGSGRKLIQRVLNADLAIDEITAHARAAFELKPDVDTIIEIGGQDSKFTVVRSGRVVFSTMNFVCAAGTGSFLEEQARRLGVSLEEYARIAESAPAPLTSDRCTVFMERDLNYLLSQGYSREELLAAAIHSVRDNYLSKVANPQKIGNVIVFQGATGRNAALVKAFEYKLGKPIYVSPYCHVAGAIGVALLLRERNVRLSPSFRHHFEEVTVHTREEVCTLCTNHCKIAKIELDGEQLGWGYLCGREEGDVAPRNRRAEHNYVREASRILTQAPPVAQRSGSKSAPVHRLPLPHLREKIFELRSYVGGKQRATEKKHSARAEIRIGIPSTLNYLDTLPLWRALFQELGFVVVAPKPTEATLQRGRSLVEAEFCTPIALLHGHVAELAERSDYIFLPVIFRNGLKEWNKHYCYYSNYAPALLLNNAHLDLADRTISPMIDLCDDPDEIAEAIHAELPTALRNRISPGEIRRAWNHALEWYESQTRALRKKFAAWREALRDFGVVLIGRPYITLDERLSHRVAERIAEMGIPVFYQEMLPLDDGTYPVASEYLRWNHWHYGEQILRAAEFAARDRKLFPIYLTAFKCSPDSFVIPYFRELMDRYDKPYLVLQLDDHSAAEGFETRLEAAIESFRNHRPSSFEPVPVRIRTSNWPRRKTYLLPNYDPYSTELIAAAFRRRGLEAIPLEETDETVRASVRYNDGQCLPFSAMLQAIQHTVKKYNLDPTDTGFFINSLCELSCNLPQYPALMKQMLEKLGGGLENLEILATSTTFQEMPLSLLVDIYCGYLLGGLLQKLACKVRPRERIPGSTEQVLNRSLARLAQAFEEGSSKELAFRQVVDWFLQIPVQTGRDRLPKVAIIGDLYVRDNHVFNQNLIRELENIGAEVITTPYSFIVRLLAIKHLRSLVVDRKYANFAVDKSLLLAFTYYDRKFTRISYPVLKEPMPKYEGSLLVHLERYHMNFRHPGETSQNLLKIFHLLEQYPDIQLFVHVNPIFCCPGLVSEAIFKRVEEDIGIPIVSIVYDGTKGEQNQAIRPYIHFIRERMMHRSLETRGSSRQEEGVAA